MGLAARKECCPFLGQPSRAKSCVSGVHGELAHTWRCGGLFSETAARFRAGRARPSEAAPDAETVRIQDGQWLGLDRWTRFWPQRPSAGLRAENFREGIAVGADFRVRSS